MSRGYYGIFGNTIYEIVRNRYEPKVIMTPKESGVYTRMFGDSAIDVTISLSDLEEDALTNKEMLTDAISKIQTESIKEIDKLGEACKLVLYYKLICGTPDCPIIPSGKVSEIADEGCMVSDLVLAPALFPLGLTDDCEYVTRWVLTTGTAKLVRNYVQSTPIGISRHRESNYTLLIDRISLIEKKEKIGEDPHPSIEKYNDIYPNSSSSITIFDTESQGIKINPIMIPVSPKQISIHVEITLNDYFVTASKDDINQYLLKNIEDEKSEEDIPTNPGEDQSDINSENGGKKPSPDDNEGTNTKPETPDDTKDDHATGSEGADTPEESESSSESESKSTSESGVTSEQDPIKSESTSEESGEKSESGSTITSETDTGTV